ncbi:MAG: antitoxin VbhA family protein [Acidobacteria bacterium]|nr:antitoxin VbhA family protein [Acidobacteriota bacterium]
MAGSPAEITERERSEREARVVRAVASVRLEGLEPTASAMLIFARYAAGDLTVEGMAAEIRALNARDFGPA